MGQTLDSFVQYLLDVEGKQVATPTIQLQILYHMVQYIQ
jgi:hypothetical protein